MPVRLSVIIPARNEAARIEAGRDRLLPVLEDIGLDHVEVIVVDDGSDDDTGKVAARAFAQLPRSLVIRREANQGKGSAIRLGVASARGENVITCDADMAISPEHIPAMLEALSHSPIAVGSRAVDGAIRYDSFLRTKAGEAFNAMVRRAVPNAPRDTQCGFKGFQLGAARLLFDLGLVDGFAYDVEMLHLASRLSLDVATVAVTWDDISGSSVHLMSDSWKMLKEIRQLPARHYDAVCVRLASTVTLEAADDACRASRLQGVVLARGETDSLLVLPRDGSVAGIGIAAALGGSLGVATLEELSGRVLEAR